MNTSVVGHWVECSVAATRSNPNEVVVVAEANTAQSTVFAASLDGGVTFSNQLLGIGIKDNHAVREPDSDRIWMLGFGSDLAIRFAWRDPGQTSVPGAQVSAFFIGSNSRDKPLLGIGWTPDVGPRRFYTLFQGGAGPEDVGCNTQSQVLWSAYSNDPAATAWTNVRVETPQAGDCDYRGQAPFPVVLNSGRIVVAAGDVKVVGSGAWRYNDGKPFVVYSGANGLSWEPGAIPPVKVGSAPTIEAPLASDSPWGVDRSKHFPSIARDPTDPQNVYVAFVARRAPGDSNLDVYIAKSTNGGASFPLLTSNFLQLTDSLLGIPEPAGDDADQLMPAIAIDGCGDVNLVFYQRTCDPMACQIVSPCNAPDYLVAAYYARIRGFGSAAPDVYVKRLSPVAFPVPYFETDPGAAQYLGDYQHLAVGGMDDRTLYAAYTARACTGTAWTDINCYVHKIRVTRCLLSDLNLSGAAEPEDITVFADAFVQGDAETADLTGEGDVDWADATAFFEAYEREGGA